MHGASRPSRSTTRAEFAAWFGRGAGATVGALLVLLIAAGLAAAGRALLLVFIALLLGAALEPLVGSLRGRIRMPRTLAILLVYAAFLVLAVAVVALLVPSTLAQAGQLASAAPGAADNVRGWAGSLSPHAVGDAIIQIVDSLQAALPGPGRVPTAQLLETGATVADVVVSFMTVLTLVFFWMTERARLQRFALSYLPSDRRAGVREAWNGIEARLGRWVRGELALMGAMGIMIGTACFILGLPSPILLGLIAGLAEAIPIAGPLIGIIPPVVVAATMKPEVLPFLLVAYVVIHAIEGNILAPLVMGNAAGISPFLVIASLLVGGAIAGLMGAFIAVPVAAALEVILERLQDRERPVTPSTEPVDAEEADSRHGQAAPSTGP
jgi:predicted PurR-regulated permease PerM